MPEFDDARNVWDSRFDTDAYIFGTDPNRFLVSQSHRLEPGARALSVADGEGRNSVWLAQRGLKVEAVEISPRAVDKARKLAAERGVNVRFKVADVRKWRWPVARYDVIVAIFVQFASPSERTRLFDRIRNALKPGGLFILEGYGVRQMDFGTGGPPCADHLYTREMLDEAFRDFEILLLEEREDSLEEGTKHVGRSALVDLIARKPSSSDESAPPSATAG
jgi:cyclopropane fatty-acyl-phospholipid synthase-like methyltransferase